MQRLSDRLSRELLEHGNLPISAESIVRLRPDLADKIATAQSMLADEIDERSTEPTADLTRQSESVLLEAQFLAGTVGAIQKHLFVMEDEGSARDAKRIKRWSKMPISYGSFLQVQRFLKEVWGEVHDLELKRSHIQLS